MIVINPVFSNYRMSDRISVNMIPVCSEIRILSCRPVVCLI